MVRVWSRWMRLCQHHCPVLQVGTRGLLEVCGATWCHRHSTTSTTHCQLAVRHSTVACLQRPDLRCLLVPRHFGFSSRLNLLRFHWLVIRCTVCHLKSCTETFWSEALFSITSDSEHDKCVYTMTISHSLKHSTWLRIALCGGCCRCQALCTLRVACQLWWRRRLWVKKLCPYNFCCNFGKFQ